MRLYIDICMVVAKESFTMHIAIEKPFKYIHLFINLFYLVKAWIHTHAILQTSGGFSQRRPYIYTMQKPLK